MILSLITEATECDFKIKLERNKIVNWLKSVSVFDNCIGGTLFFGVDDDGKKAKQKSVRLFAYWFGSCRLPV
jgi:ATP-dependent DNA helicase RecG